MNYMNNRIWKFELGFTDFQQIWMPSGAKILTVQIQNGIPCLWAMVDSIAEYEWRNIGIVGTGNPINFKGEYIDTIQLDGFVWHVFEIISQ